MPTAVITGLISLVLAMSAALYAQFPFHPSTNEQPAASTTIPTVIREPQTPTEELPVETISPSVLPSEVLSVSGIIFETNVRRRTLGLPPLQENSKLSSAAKLKVDDMFTKQYFEHESPTGEDVGSMAKRAGYDYREVGENLALGIYESDAALVDAWMESAGHRENIVSERFTEIGVFAREGMYEGELVWMAVQEFGRPMPACDAPNETLFDDIEERRATLGELKNAIRDMREEIDDLNASDEGYDELVAAYNTLATEYNNLLDETTTLVEIYNRAVAEYNECIEE